MKKVLVVGGAGYIGSCMVRTLIAHRFPAVVFDNLSTGHRDLVPRGVPFVRGDLRSPRDVRAAFRLHDVDAVMHFAASSLVGESVQDPLKYYGNNVSACVNLLRAMGEHGVKRFIFSSTAAVFGEPARLPIREDDPKVPTNPYGQSKLAIEHMLRDVARTGTLSYVILRYFNACGAHASGEIGERHDPETHLIPNILKALTGEKKKLVIFGDDYPTPDGTCVRDYIHIEDLCDAHLLALKALRRGMKSDVFNLGNGSGYSVKAILRAVEKVAGRRVPFTVGPRRPGDPARLVASAAKAARALGWKPKRTLEDIVSSAWRWESKDRDA